MKFKNLIIKTVFLLALVFSVESCIEKEAIEFRVNTGSTVQIEHPIAINLDDLNLVEWTNLEMYRKTENANSRIPFQVDKQQLVFLHSNDLVSYVIKKGASSVLTSKLSSKKQNGELELAISGKPLINYRFGMKYPPKGVDSVFKKSGYIHPLRTPNGDTLTRIQPPDHLHHYGIWGPWTHTQINGQRVDFWNLGDRKGTVLFKEFKNISSGNLFSSFDAIQEHIDLITKPDSQVALEEVLNVKLWDLDRKDRYMLDYTSSFSSPLKEGILFEAYRYGGGIGMRFNERWHKDNCSVLTSEGNDRLTADGTNARWCIVKGEASDGKGTNGILFLSHPENRKHPEPMRIWPIDGNHGRGDMFFEFCPIRHEEWNIDSNKEYKLNYRMIVFEGNLKPEEAEGYWQGFATSPEIEIIQ